MKSFVNGKLLTRKEVEYALEEAKASVKETWSIWMESFRFQAAYHRN